jgi:large subunit ribosomal protein L19
MSGKIIAEVAARGSKTEKIPDFRVGDTVKLHCRIYEGDKERTQLFTGTVIARKGRGASESFTVRRISHGVGVERIFPVRTPHLAKIEVVSSSHVRRAKLYYLRTKVGKKGRLKEKIREQQTEAAPAAS